MANQMSTQTDPIFTTDWSRSISYWPDMFQTLGLTGKPDLRFLEIGCFEGRTTLWLLENVLTDPSSKITVIDTFEGSVEFEPHGIDCNFYERFIQNLGDYIGEKVRTCIGSSGRLFQSGVFWGETFDFIYVDGSHAAADVLSDAVLSWPLLKSGGVMCFDDYLWGAGLMPEWDRPQIAIEAFIRCYAPQLKGSPQGYDHFVAVKN